MDVEKLKKQILAANTAYRDGHPTMDDQTFDDLCESLEKSISIDEYSAFRDSLHELKGKVKHPFIMGSLDKTKAEEPENVKKFIREHISTCMNVSAKVDGISARAHYENGRLMSLTTRGNGEFGESLNDKMNFIKCLHQEISTKDTIDVRGELVILKNDFDVLNEKYDGKFANARNACAGIMNQKEWDKDDVSHVSFVAYTILGKVYPKDQQFNVLKDLGFYVAWNENYTSFFYEKDSFVNKLVEDASQDFPYTTDGLVICDSTYRNEEKYRPDACVAFKLNQQVAETTLIDVEWQGPSKDGVFVGVGILEPIVLGDATIERVTLHNLDFISKHNLMYGSKVKIMRSGDVIPKLIEVVCNDSHCKPIEIPSECMCCGSTLVRDGVNMRCINHSCPEQVVHRLVNFIKKLGVKSASNATLLNFGITSFDKLISFTPNKKYKSEVKLYDELYAKVFSQSKEKLLGAMNFIGLSETLIGKIVSYYGIDAIDSNGSITKFIEMTKARPLPNGIGLLTLDAFIDGLPEALDNMHKVINDVRWHWVKASQNESRDNISLKGSICVTGNLKFGSRSKFLEFAKEHGYESKSGVSKGLTYLINNDINSSSSKNKKAKALGIRILSEDDFMKIINSNEIEYDLASL